MNENTIKIGILVTGLGVGGGVGYFLAQRKFRLLADEEIESVRQAFKELQAISRKEASDAPAEKQVPSAPVHMGPLNTPTLGPRDEASEKQFVAYNQIMAAQGYVGSTDSEVDPRTPPNVRDERVDVEVDGREVKVSYHNGIDQESSLVTAAVYEERIDGRPYVIDVGEFINNEADFEVFTMTWHPADQVLVYDDSQDVVDDLAVVGGAQVLTLFGQDIHNPYTLYIRDERNEKLFEIVQDARRYTAGDSV